MFTPEDRARIRASLIDAARIDTRITGGAITGSASVENEDRWSDIDLAFGVRGEIAPVLDGFTERMRRDHDAVHTVDVTTGTWIYRVFLLRNTLQVDLAFAPESDFGARAPTFRLLFGSSRDIAQIQTPHPEHLVGLAWLYALHVRSSIKRGHLWQAEYMLSAMRDHILTLACVRLGLMPREGRGFHQLPADVTTPLEGSLVRRLTTDELVRAFRVATHSLLIEAARVDEAMAERIRGVVIEIAN